MTQQTKHVRTRSSGSYWKPVVTALAAVILGTAARFALDGVLGTSVPFITFFPAVALAVFVGGWQGGVLAVILSGLVADYFFIPPRHAFLVISRQEVFTVGTFIFTAGIIVAFGEALHRAHRREQSSGQNLAESEAQFRRIVETANEGIWILDAEAKVSFVNPRMAQMLGCSPEEMIGRHKWDFVFPEDVRRARELFGRRQAGISETVEMRFRTRTGDELWTLMSARPVFEPHGGFSGALDLITDITDRRKADEALREGEARLRAALDAGQMGVWEWDIEKNKVQWTERLYEFHGLRPGEFDGTVEAFTKLIHPEDLPRVQKALERALHDKTPYDLEFRVSWPDGQVRWLKTAARVVYDNQDKPVRMLGGTVDLTEQKRQAELLESQAKHLEEIVQARTARLQETIGELEAFSYSISHDMRGPLRAMQGFSNTLQEEYGPKLDATARDYLQRIDRAAVRLDRLIQGVLSYSRMARAQMPLQSADLKRIIADVIEQYPGLQKEQAKIIIEEPLPAVLGHEASLTQVFSNLLGNAVKFVPAGRTPEIRISAETHADTVKVLVADNGIGINTKDYERIFHIFEQVHQSGAYPGTGIGLSIVKKAVERMGGRVGVTSEPGKGSCFWLELRKAPG